MTIMVNFFGWHVSLYAFIVCVLFWISCGIAGARVGMKTGNGLFGFFMGFAFGPLGLVIVLCRVVGHVPPSLSDPEDPFSTPVLSGRSGPIRLRAAPRVFKMRRT